MINNLQKERNDIPIQNNNTEMYFIVKNSEGQYSIWPNYKPLVSGWERVGDEKTKTECLNYIENDWLDMRPLSLKDKS